MDPDSEFIQAVRSSSSVAGVLRALGRAIVGSNYKFVHQGVERLGLDTAHWTGQAHGSGSRPTKVSSEILVEDSLHSTGLVKSLVLREALLDYVCTGCGN